MSITGRLGMMMMVAAHLGFSGVGPALGQVEGEEMTGFDVQLHESPVGTLTYRLFTPQEWREPRRLLVMLHGCTQDAADLAAGTGMNDLGEEGGFAVLYPEQSPEAQPQRCWTWYDAAQQTSEGPEAAKLFSLVAQVTTAAGVTAEGTYLAGISAGAAMANVLAVLRPDLFAGLALHSGIAFGAAADVGQGLAAMQQGGPAEKIAVDGPAFEAVLAAPTPLRVAVLHGAADAVVRPVNGTQVAEQWASILDGRYMVTGSPHLQATDEASVEANGRTMRVREWVDADGDVRIFLGLVSDLGHAWSGGSDAGTYTDPAGPSASRLFATFLGLLER